MNQTELLLVEDSPQLLKSLNLSFTAEGFSVREATTGSAALAALLGETVDIVVLDLGLPDMDGSEVIRRAREWSDTPIVVLSARHSEQQKIDALNLGADDYVSKPFALGELMARMRAVMRGRERRSITNSPVSVGPLRIDPNERRVWFEGCEVRLRPREYDLLKVFVRHAGAALTHRQIIAAVWGDQGADPQVLRVLVGQLRQKLDPRRGSQIIRTEPTVGYRLVLEDHEPSPDL